MPLLRSRAVLFLAFAFAGMADDASGNQSGAVEAVASLDLAGIDSLVGRHEVDLGILNAQRVVEAAFRDPHVERHLAAFEALDRHARA